MIRCCGLTHRYDRLPWTLDTSGKPAKPSPSSAPTELADHDHPDPGPPLEPTAGRLSWRASTLDRRRRPPGLNTC